MSKINEARDILEQLGLPSAQRNDISCLTLLALAGISEDSTWSESYKPSLTIHQILGFMKETYGREYAENTRETVRRQVIHQFEHARLVDRNPDQPDLPTNSPRSHYGLTDEALDVLQLYHRSDWKPKLLAFRSSHGRSWRYTSGGGRCGRYQSASPRARNFVCPRVGTINWNP